MANNTSAARQALLGRCVAFLQRNGFSQLSLREIAAGAGTSHRMLIYHFGSREGLLAEIVGRMEAEQRAALADLASATGDPIEIAQAFWQRVSDPALAGAERLFFEIYSHALYGRTWTEPFRSSVIAAWEGPLISLFVSQGCSHEEAPHRARLSLAATRGLLMDLLMTGDRAAVDGAAELLGRLMSGQDRSAAL